MMMMMMMMMMNEASLFAWYSWCCYVRDETYEMMNKRLKLIDAILARDDAQVIHVTHENREELRTSLFEMLEKSLEEVTSSL